MRRLMILSLSIFGFMVSFAEELQIPRQNVYPVRDRAEIRSLNGEWKFKYIPGKKLPAEYIHFYQPEYDDSSWGEIRVPANWETEGYKEPQYGADIEEAWGLYRRTFRLDPAWQGRHIILRLDGVLFGYEVYVNGKSVGSWGSAYNLCQFDITPYVSFGQTNTLAVQVTTRNKGWKFDLNDCWALAGIFRDVELFSVANIHLKDVTFRSEFREPGKVSLSFDVEADAFSGQREQVGVQIRLTDETGKVRVALSQSYDWEAGKSHFETEMEYPDLWTAETPYLYQMQVYLVGADKSVIQQVTEKVGIREVRVQRDLLLVNGKAVNLRGVCYNQMNPFTGRVFTLEDWRRDLLLMKQANINFIRTAHYPLDYRFYQLCDELGFYVCCEVPFGYGDKNLYDSSYIPVLCTRAEATLTRDKNHPCVIMWTVGNENPYTEDVAAVLRYVKAKDPTRPRALPMVGSYFMKVREELAEQVDIYAFHYQSVKSVEKIALLKEKPIILTEYSHSLGLAFDVLEEQYQLIRKYQNIAGGCVWDWADQALLRHRVAGAYEADTLVQGVWKDSLYYYDSFQDRGTDGIVYANRYPQEDYWQVRRVYSPVVLLDETLPAEQGAQQLTLQLENRFDFISLRGYTCHWQLINRGRELSRGEAILCTPACSREKIGMEIKIPSKNKGGDYWLACSIRDPQGHSIYEKSIPLKLKEGKTDYLTTLNAGHYGSRYKVVKKEGLRVEGGDYVFSCTPEGKLSLTNKEGKLLMNTSLLLRVGRKPTINLLNLGVRRKEVFYWNPYLLDAEILDFSMNTSKSIPEVVLNCRWKRGEKPEEYIDGVVKVNLHENGVAEFDYTLHPQQVSGSFMEYGLALALEPTLSVFRWLGEGPYTATPGKKALNDRGVWALNKNDIHFVGNRGNVDVALIQDAEGNSVGYVSRGRQCGVENRNGQIVISDNLLVSGYGTKLSRPVVEWKANEVKERSGHFYLVVLNAEKEYPLFDSIFNRKGPVVPEMPFLKSYGH